MFRVEEVVQDDRYVMRVELSGMYSEKDIEVSVEGGP